jgi:hypothetical protein
VTNCILWDGVNGIWNNDGSSITVSFSDLQGGWTGPGGDNMDVDPNFVDVNNPDPNLRDYHLRPGSLCVDAGDNSAVPVHVTTDLDGHPRFFDDPFTVDTGVGSPPIVDIGAYELQERENRIRFVDPNASGAGDGSSWSDAYRYLQDAFVNARAGDVILVAAGTYKPDQGGGQSLGNRQATFQLRSDVMTYGGHAGSSGTDPNERNVTKYKTILSGEIGVAGTDADNSHHVVTGSGTGASSLLDGFFIIGGNANSAYPDDRGGGAYNVGGSLIVSNCVFYGNKAILGGGMYNWGSPTLNSCAFSGNWANQGGGIYNDDSSPTVINCTFSGNSALIAGGLYNHFYGLPILMNCIFWGNTASTTAVKDDQIFDDYPSISLMVEYTCVQGGWTGTGNIDTDPLLVDANGPDSIAGTADDNLRLSAGSPCVDSGNSGVVPPDIADIDGDGNTVEPTPLDLGGRARIVDGDCNDSNIVDMGAYEFSYTSVGDFDGDCDVEFADFAILALAWLSEDGQVQYNPACDIGIPADDSIDWHDVDVFANNWLAGRQN